jgi:hypothetical protein
MQTQTFDLILFFFSGGGCLVGLFTAALLWASTRANRRANRLFGRFSLSMKLTIGTVSF